MKTSVAISLTLGWMKQPLIPVACHFTEELECNDSGKTI